MLDIRKVRVNLVFTHVVFGHIDFQPYPRIVNRHGLRHHLEQRDAVTEALEDRLGARLFTRTTRSVSLTDAGRRLYGEAGRILEDVEQAEAHFTMHAADAGAASSFEIQTLFPAPPPGTTSSGSSASSSRTT